MRRPNLLADWMALLIHEPYVDGTRMHLDVEADRTNLLIRTNIIIEWRTSLCYQNLVVCKLKFAGNILAFEYIEHFEYFDYNELTYLLAYWSVKFYLQFLRCCVN